MAKRCPNLDPSSLRLDFRLQDEINGILSFLPNTVGKCFTRGDEFVQSGKHGYRCSGGICDTYL